MLDGIWEELIKKIHELLEGFVLANMEFMYEDVNTRVGTIATEVSKTPQAWNGDIFSLIRRLTDSVMMPIAGAIITYVLCYELISMVIEKNTLHDLDTWLFFKYVFKAAIAVYLVSHTMDITLAFFDVGKHLASSASGIIASSTDVDVKVLMEKMKEQMSEMEIGELFALGMESAFVSVLMKIMSVVITVTLYARMIEIYLYISVAPIPFATLTNREWGQIGTHYIKGLLALAFQAFFIMVCVGIYGVLVANIQMSENIHSALFGVTGYALLLMIAIRKTGAQARSVFAV